jgi:uncharacterized repeat protein (TIGR03803 family)
MIVVWAIASMVIVVTAATGKTAEISGLASQGAAPDATVAAAFSESVLWNFGATSDDGANPETALLFDKQGNLYGTTSFGGTNNLGTVIELSPPSGQQTQWTERVLWAFGGTSSDGWSPQAGLIADNQGNLYGTTFHGGAYCYSTPPAPSGGCGIVFELSPPSGQQTQWTERVLWSFDANSDDGAYPEDGLIADNQGNLYGTTNGGGGTCSFSSAGCGTVFELSPPSGAETQWSERVLWSFTVKSDDGRAPVAGLIVDQLGNFYGTTQYGGVKDGGTAFELSPPSGGQMQWSERVLWSFGAKKADGNSPVAGLIADPQGNFYGSTAFGGAKKDGVAFELSPPSGKQKKWSERLLHSFGAKNDGQGPSGLIADQQGNLYGTTFNGGTKGDGIVFELRKR